MADEKLTAIEARYVPGSCIELADLRDSSVVKQLLSDLAYLLRRLKAAEAVVVKADIVAQVRMEPWGSWEILQDLRNSLTTWQEARG